MPYNFNRQSRITTGYPEFVRVQFLYSAQWDNIYYIMYILRQRLASKYKFEHLYKI